LNQSASNFLDQSASNFLDQSASNFLDQSASNFLDGLGLGLNVLQANNVAYSHGTLCAGLITSTAPGAMVMPLRVFDENGYADTYAITKAIRYAVSHGAHVINLSFGTLDQSMALRNAIEFAAASNVVVVTSAGNNNTSALQWPAGYSSVIATAATNLDDTKGDFSNFGNHVDISSPGVNIISAYPGGLYSVASGTSFSAPIVAGAVAVLRSQNINGVTSALADGTINIDASNPGYAGKLGVGRLDILRAAQAR
jgi:subtilisin family serine protease